MAVISSQQDGGDSVCSSMDWRISELHQLLPSKRRRQLLEWRGDGSCIGFFSTRGGDGCLLATGESGGARISSFKY
ncbi:hypothetical protein TIFTF001_024389 [Ficus carica]|uniref:Uncharacterized protein n=1 Tax=Ficus carica TaxID=3494 RepID=A0AA88B0N6_FICCA|nr:hypothetical protein TIFTF001_024389 [Ficus carica]